MKFDIKKDWKFWLVLITTVTAILSIGLYKINLINFGKTINTAVTIFSIMITVIMFFIAIVIYYEKNIKPEKLFWLIIPAVFIMFLIIMPAFKSHDEAFHWFRIYDIAQGNYLTKIEDNRPLTNVPEEVVDITNMEPENIKYGYIINQLTNGISSDSQCGIELATTAIYSPIQYLPQTMRSTNS